MIFLGIFLVFFGLTIVLFPQFLAYIIGFFLIFVGLNILMAAVFFRRGPTQSSGWKVGGYEIIRNRK